MILRGLSKLGENDLAHEIAINHHHNVVEVFAQTGTLWEDYAPEKIAPGIPARPNFVGWSGLPPIAVLLEYIFGLRPDVSTSRLIWDIRLLEEHGVEQYPFGKAGTLSLRCHARRTIMEQPLIQASSTIPCIVDIRWPGGRKELPI